MTVNEESYASGLMCIFGFVIFFLTFSQSTEEGDKVDI